MPGKYGPLNVFHQISIFFVRCVASTACVIWLSILYSGVITNSFTRANLFLPWFPSSQSWLSSWRWWSSCWWSSVHTRQSFLALACVWEQNVIASRAAQQSSDQTAARLLDIQQNFDKQQFLDNIYIKININSWWHASVSLARACKAWEIR